MVRAFFVGVIQGAVIAGLALILLILMNMLF